MFEKWRIKEHMEVADAAGRHLGTVDSVDGDIIRLTRSDSADGQHHLLDFDTVDRIDDNRVYLKEGVTTPGLEPDYGKRDDIFDAPPSRANPLSSDAIAAGYAGQETPPNIGGEPPLFGTSGLGTGMGGSGKV